MFLKILRNSQESTCARPWTCNFIKKETSGTGVLLWILFFCDVFKNTTFIEHLRWLLYICNWVWKWEDYAGCPIQTGWTFIEIIEIFHYSKFCLNWIKKMPVEILYKILQKIILYLQKIQLQYITYLLLEECRKQQFKNCLKSCSGL